MVQWVMQGGVVHWEISSACVLSPSMSSGSSMHAPHPAVPNNCAHGTQLQCSAQVHFVTALNLALDTPHSSCSI